MFKKTTLSLVVASVMAGCSSFPVDYKEDPGVPEIVEQYSDAWSHTVPLRYVQSTSGASVNRYFTLPDEIANQMVSIDLDHDMGATVGDLIYALRAQGYKVVSRLKESEEAPLLLHQFKGTLGDFVEDLGQVQNIAYEYRNGTLFILEANRYSVSLPQHEELLLQVAASLVEMGAMDVRTDILAGMVHFSARPDISDYVTEYLDRIAQNSAMISLQIAVVTVGLNRDIGYGLDWSRVMGKTGTKDMRPFLTGAIGQTDSNVPYAMGQALSFFGGGGGLAYAFNNERFSLSAVLRMLSEYGNARTEQNVVLGTVSGMPVRISSGNDIPYVKKIGSTTASGGSTSGSTDTDIIRSGLELKITPNFDSSDKSIVTTVNVNMSSLVGFRELSAGTNLGTLSQPEMQNLEFENVGRLSAGETLVIGGITYDQMSENYTSLPGMERLPIGSKNAKTNKNAIYIVIRPTVVIFSREADRLNRELEANGGRPTVEMLSTMPEAVKNATQHPPRQFKRAKPKRGKYLSDVTVEEDVLLEETVTDTTIVDEPAPKQKVKKQTKEVEVIERVEKVDGGEIRVREYKSTTEPTISELTPTSLNEEPVKGKEASAFDETVIALNSQDVAKYQNQRRVYSVAKNVAAKGSDYAISMPSSQVASSQSSYAQGLPPPYLK